MIGKFLQGCAYSLGFGFFGLLIAWWASLHLAQPADGSIQEQMNQLEAESFRVSWLIAGAVVGVILAWTIALWDRQTNEAA